MHASHPASSPELPFPIFQVSQRVERYLLYDITIITWVRQNHNILGVLIGTLPQIPQQNVFLGLPLELQPEEARVLVEKGLAYMVDDLDWHTRELESKNATQIAAIKAALHHDGIEVGRRLQSSKQIQAREARNMHRSNSVSSNSSDLTANPDAQIQDGASEETLFNEPSTPWSAPTTCPPSNSNIKPWTTTPTSSYPLLTSPPKPTSPNLPRVKPSSYALFKHLYSQGYFLTPGIRFGCQFSVYPGDPLRFHSHFLAMSADWDEEIDLLDLVGGGRLGTGVKKGWLIGGVEEKGAKYSDGEKTKTIEAAAGEYNYEAKVRTFCIEWGGM